MHETFWDLARDAAHWEFEIFLMIVFDGLLLGIFYPWLRKHWKHHIAHDQRDQIYNWSMNPITQAAGHVMETSAGICPDCGEFTRVSCSGRRYCLGCGPFRG